MVLRTTGASWLTLMMRAERAQHPDWGVDSAWLLYGPEDPDVVADETAPPQQFLAAE